MPHTFCYLTKKKARSNQSGPKTKGLLAKFTTLHTSAAEHLAVLLLGHTLAALLNY